MEAFLDTHVLVWLYDSRLEHLSVRAKTAIEESELWASPISLLEVDYLHEVKKFAFNGKKLFEELHHAIGLQLADDPFAAIVATASKLSWTREPFDRLLVAHALHRQIPLVTKDRVLRRHTRCIW